MQFAIISLCVLLALAGCEKSESSIAAEREAAAVDSGLRCGSDLLFTNPRRADSVFVSLQERLADSVLWHRVETFRGTAAMATGDTVLMAKRYARVLNWCGHRPDVDSVAGEVWMHRGVHYSLTGRNEAALGCYRRAYDIQSRGKKSRLYITTCINLADILSQRGNMPEAARYYQAALFAGDSLGVHSADVSVFTGLAQVYMELENYPLAHTYFDRAARRIEKEPLRTQFFFHVTRGNCLFFEKRYREALSEFKTANAMASRSGEEMPKLQCECNIGEVLLASGRTAEAAPYINRSLAHVEAWREGVDEKTAFYVTSLAAELALAEGDMARAHRLLERTQAYKNVASPRYMMQHYDRLARYAEARGRWKAAFDYKGRAHKYEDSLRSRQIVNNVAEMAQRYHRDTTVLNKQIDLSEARMHNARLQVTMISGVAVCVVVMLAIGLLAVVHRRRRQLESMRRMEQITELRMDVVRNRVSPHYVFNVLGAVIPKLRNYPELTQPMELLVDVLRGNLLASGKVAVALADEMSLVRRFTELWAYSHGEPPRVKWEVEEALEASATLMVPTMCLQIPVENALKHAFPQPTAESEIRVSVKREGEDLVLTVSDNGIGFNPGNVRATRRDTGTGLRLLARTIALLNPYNARPARFEQHNLAAPAHGTVTRLTLPVDYDYRQT